MAEKLPTMAGHAFNQEPLVSTYGGWGRAAVIMVGPRLMTLPAGKFGPYHEQTRAKQRLSVIGEGYFPLTSIRPATDHWPFLYLRDQSFPSLYILGLAMVGVFALGGTSILPPRKALRHFHCHRFCLGVA